MAIAQIRISHPSAGAKLPRRFLAFGTKEPDGAAKKYKVHGVMMSLDSGGNPDGKYLIGSETLVYKPDPKGTTTDSSKWLLKFEMPLKLNPRVNFILVVFYVTDLPTTINDTPATQAGLSIKRRPRSTKKAKSHGIHTPESFHLVVDYPAMSAVINKPDFIAYGELPTGDYEVDDSQTELVDQANSNIVGPTSSGMTFESGFWYRYFDIPAAMTKADLTVVYTPYDDEEIVTDLNLT